MTLVLRSDKVSSGRLGNIHGYLGPSDYRALLDFNRGEYYYRDSGVLVPYTLSNVVTVSRAASGEYVDRNGVTQTALANEPRIHYMSDVGYAGLLGEPAATNLALSPTSPPSSQSITIPAGGASIPILISVWGSGDATLDGSNVTRATEVATPFGKVIAYTKSVSTSFSTNLAITGTVTRIQAEHSTVGPVATSFTTGTRPIETATLKAPFKDLFSGGQGTILAHYVSLPSPAVTNTIVRGSLYAYKSGLQYGGVYHFGSTPRSGTVLGSDSVRTGADSATTGTLTTARATMTGAFARRFVYGIGFEDDGATARVMSYRQTERATGIATTFTAPDTIGILGGSGVAAASIAGGASVSAICTHVVIYDRFLSAEEAQLAVTQWP